MALAELLDVSIAFGKTPVLSGVTLALHPGDRLGLAGPNGAGKTTLLALLATLHTPTGGQGWVLGARLGTREVLDVRPSIGWSSHEPALYDDLTLAENLGHLARLAGSRQRQADEALALVGLERAADRKAADCSNGMRRRADLARLLLTRPRLVLLDEAQAGLDAEAGVIVDAIVARALDAEGGAVLVSHDAGRLAPRVDRVLQITDGAVA